MITVNWVQEDEELLEPYEWIEYDDIEEISDYQLIKVDEKTYYDFIYGCMNILDKQYYSLRLVLCNEKSCIVVEFDALGKLIYRGVCDFTSRDKIILQAKDLQEQALQYTLYDEGLPKEYGLTRYERMKKQHVENTVDQMYVDQYDEFISLCNQLQIHGERPISRYITLKKKIEKGYTFLHEMLYCTLIENK